MAGAIRTDQRISRLSSVSLTWAEECISRVGPDLPSAQPFEVVTQRPDAEYGIKSPWGQTRPEEMSPCRRDFTWPDEISGNTLIPRGIEADIELRAFYIGR